MRGCTDEESAPFGLVDVVEGVDELGPVLLPVWIGDAQEQSHLRVRIRHDTHDTHSRVSTETR